MVATVITEAVSSMMGWLENGLDFHVSKDEEGMEGKSVVLVSNASLEASLTSSTKALGMRVVSHACILGIDAHGAGTARQRRTQYGRLTKVKKRMPKVKFYRKYGAIASKIAKAGLMPSRLHGMRYMGMPPTRVKAFRTTIGRCLQANTLVVRSRGDWSCTRATRFTRAGWSRLWRKQRQSGMSSWTMRSCTGRGGDGSNDWWA